MQEYRKLLCVNKIRETKRLIENMLIPILSLVVAAAVVGYQIVINFFPIIRKINACNLRICYLVFGFLILYSFGVCFINVKPAIIIKPASLFFIQEKKIRQMISIKYIGLTLKDIIFSIILSACINGIHLNRNFLFILLIIFLLLNTTNLMKWKIYHANQRRDIGIWLLFSIILVISLKYFFMCIIDIGIWMYMLVYDFGVLEINALKYEDEMQFLEKVRIAQNFNNTVLLNQYAKEKTVRYLQRKNKVSNFLCHFPLIWKAQISIYRLGRNWIIMGMILFTICLGIYKMPFYWTLPFLQQEEIRYMLLLGSIFAVFRLTLRSMVQQLDSILEKATDGLFIPISENRIVKQFMVIPITIVCGEGIIMAFVVNSSIAQILLGCAILICATVLNLWLEVKYKNFLVKKDFILREIMGDIVLVPINKSGSQFNGLITINELGKFLVSNWLYVILTIVLTAFIMVVWYGCMIVFGVWDRLDEWFYPNNIINSLIGSIIYFVVLIFPIAASFFIVGLFCNIK